MYLCPFIKDGWERNKREYIVFVGNLMADHGLEDVMRSAFGSVAHMLDRMGFLQSFKGMRHVTKVTLLTTNIWFNLGKK